MSSANYSSPYVNVSSLLVQNSSTNQSQQTVVQSISAADMLKFKLVVATIYLVLGVSMVSIDGALTMTILISKELRRRKETLFVFGLFLGDVIFGLAFITSSINRFVVLAYDIPLLTPFQCILRPFLVFFVFGQLLSAAMMFMTSVDRLICECRFFLYVDLDKWYRYLGLGVPMALVIGFTTASWLDAAIFMPQQATIAAECSQNLVISVKVNMFLSFAQHVPAILSVVLYICVMLIYRIRGHKAVVSVGVAKVQRKRQKEHTKVLSLVCVTNMILYTLTSVCSLPGTNLTAGWPQMVAMGVLYSSVVSRGLCAIANAVVFLVRPNDVQEQFLQLVRKYVLRRQDDKVKNIGKTSSSNGNNNYNSQINKKAAFCG